MRYVEHAGVASHVVVFINLGTIVDWHFPTRKINQAGVAPAVLFEQGSALESRGTHAKKTYNR
jgi:hypothetical protein